MVEDLETKFEFPIAGSLRIGEKNERNIPQKLNYFTVHEDTHTINDVVQLFNANYDKPTELIIKFLSDNPLETSYLKYGKSGLLCKGDGRVANCKGENGWIQCQCSKECDYRGAECKLTGRLYFIIKGLNIGGLWRLQTQSYNTIRNFLTTLNFLKCMGVNIKEKEFRLATEERTSIVDGKAKKFTTVNLKMIGLKEDLVSKKENQEDKTEVINKKNSKTKQADNIEITNNTTEENKKDDKKHKTKDNKEDDFEKCLTLVELKDVLIGEKTVKQATFCNMKDEVIDVLLHPNIVDDVCKWEVASCIIPVNIYQKNNHNILKEYKDIGIIRKVA